MSIEDAEPYYTDNQEDQFYQYCYMDHEDDQDLSFPEEYLKNISDCSKTPSQNSHISGFPTSKTLQIAKSLDNIHYRNEFQQKQSQKIIIDRIIEQTSPFSKTSEETAKFNLINQEKTIRITKKKYKKKIEIILNYKERLLQSRQIKLLRYRQKKLKRNWERGILYEERKKLACRRQRVQGRFQGKSDDMLNTEEQKFYENLLSQ